jgi:uncharacterized C2H2 Zn-finger protein
MTPRQLFQRRRKLFHRIAVPIAVALICAWVFTHPHRPRSQALLENLAFGVVFAIVLIPIANRLFSCPRCGTSFRRYRIEKLGRFSLDMRSAEDLWDACPQCGLSFDQQWP